MLCSESSSQQVVHNRLWIAVDMWRNLDLIANESQLTRNSTPILSANAKSDAIGGVVTIPNEVILSWHIGPSGVQCTTRSGLLQLLR